MNLSLYNETVLEQWIYGTYQQHCIKVASNLTLERLADAFNCEIVFWNLNTKAVWDDDCGTIFLNEQLTDEEIREAFFHELGHTFLHVGNQFYMPQSFSEYQEEQVSLFVLYASMPIFMIKQYELPHTENCFMKLLINEFNVSKRLAIKRIDQIKARILQEQSHQQFLTRIAEQRSAYDPLDPARWSEETKRIMDQLNRQLARKGEVILAARR